MELRDIAVAAEWRVVAGHCLDFGDSALPYLPFSEVLGRIEAELPELVSTVTYAHPALSRLRPGRRVMDAGTDVASPASPASPLRMWPASTVPTSSTPCTPCSRRRPSSAPLLVVVEDCHWADQSTRDLLSFLFSRPFEGPVAVVASYRADDLHRRHPLRRQVAEWSRLRGVERLQLSPLPDDDVRALVARAGALRGLRPPAGHDRRPGGRQRVLRGGARRRRGHVGAPHGPGRSPAGAARPARRPRPAGGAGRERRGPQGLPRPARGDVRSRRAPAGGGGPQGRRDPRPGRRRRSLLVPARPARRGRLRRPAAGRTGPPARRVRRRAGRRPRPRDRRRAGPPRPSRQRPRCRAVGGDPRRRRGRGGRGTGRSRPPLPAGARAARRPGSARALLRRCLQARGRRCRGGHQCRPAAARREAPRRAARPASRWRPGPTPPTTPPTTPGPGFSPPGRTPCS